MDCARSRSTTAVAATAAVGGHAMTKLFVTFGFAIAFAAGLMLGVSRHPGEPRSGREPDADGPLTGEHDPGTNGGGQHSPGGRASWLAQQLDLAPEQQEQLKQIWSDVAGRGGRHQWERRRELHAQRDAAVEKLVRPEDRAAYEQIVRDYEGKTAAIETEWRQSFESAVERTRGILTPEQREKFEQ